MVKALAELGADGTVLDGEGVLLHPDGHPNFHGLRAARSANAVAYVVFDLLFLEGRDLRGWPLDERRNALRDLICDKSPHLSANEVFEASGAAVFAAVCRMGAEGIVSKRRDSRYVAGRGRAWLKVLNAPVSKALIGPPAGRGDVSDWPGAP